MTEYHNSYKPSTKHINYISLTFLVHFFSSFPFYTIFKRQQRDITRRNKTTKFLELIYYNLLKLKLQLFVPYCEHR